MADLGRQVKYGLGKEATAGTAVAPTHWLNQLNFELNPQSEYAVNNSAYGVVEKTNEATVLRQWAEGNFEAKLTSDTSGLILLGAFGSVSSAADADLSGTVYNHTFNLNQNINGQSLTLVRKDSLSTLAYALGRFGEWSLSMELGDYVKYTANVLAKKGTATTATAAFTSETEFVPKHMTVKVGGSTISTVESFNLTVNPNLETDWEAGNGAPFGFSSRGFDLSFEMTCRYNDQTLEDAYNNGTNVALEVSAVNTDVTIGTAKNPGLVITAPKCNITDWTRNEELDSPLTQTLTGTIHYSSADARAIRAVLTNTTSSY